MVIAITIKCPICDKKYLLRQQVDYGSKYATPICFGCKCGYLFKGQFTQKDDIGCSGFVFEETLSVPYDSNTDSTIAVCADLPIGKELLYQPVTYGVFSPYLICGRTWSPFTLKLFEGSVEILYEFVNKRLDDLKKLVGFLKSGDIVAINNYINQRFGDIVSCKIQNIDEARTAVLNILLEPFKIICSPNYNLKFTIPFKDNIIDVIEKIPKAKLIDLNSELIKYYSLEQEFIRGIEISINYLEKINSFMPSLLLLHSDDFNKIYGNDFGITTADYNEIKNLYSENFELLSRISSLLFGILNLNKNGDFNTFDSKLKCLSLNEYMELANGIKRQKIELQLFLSGYFLQTIDNQIRNGIGHFKTEYNVIDQKITYFPYMAPNKIHQSKFIYLIDFCFLINQQAIKVFESMIAINRFNKRIIE